MNDRLSVAVASSKVRFSYSVDELAGFKTRINAILEKCKISFSDCREVVTNSSGNSTDDTSPTFRVLEEGNRTQEKETFSALARIQDKKIESLTNALKRIDNGTYGKCNCPECQGKLISKEELMACPQAVACAKSRRQERR